MLVMGNVTEEGLKMTNVKQILSQKKKGVFTTSPGTTVLEALKELESRNVGALPVVEGGKIVGMFSERDYARKVALKDRHADKTLVREIMTVKTFTVSPEQTIEECMAIMTVRRVRHLPVIDKDELVGIVSIGDVVNSIISEQKFTIKELEKYISGGGY